MMDPTAVWESRGTGARLLRAAMLPAAGVFRAASTIRNALYDVGAFRSHSLGAPTASVGNLSVGGTGKTPFTSWLARELQNRGARPAILLRGFGSDETRLHKLLAPGVGVYDSPDRVSAAQAARAAGADVLVLDDAFQHRKAERNEDIVLVSADAGGPFWPLPAGPWREPFRALRRATLIIVTRKAAPDDAVDRTVARVNRAAGSVALSVVRFEASDLREWRTSEARPLSDVAGRRALVVSGIGNAAAFETQLRVAGITVDAIRFPDHHAYSDAEIVSLAERGAAAGAVICTLKDAVKIGPRWPPQGGALWYVSQRIAVERGVEHVTRVVGRLLDLRPESRPGDSHR